MDIHSVNRELEEIDGELKALLQRRVRLIGELAELKRRAGGPGSALEQEFRPVDALPAPKRVCYQGIEGAYQNMAAEAFFSEAENVEFYHVDRFEDAVVEAETGRCDYCVLPIENSTAGAVVDTYDILMRHDVSLVGEYFLPIRHCLLGVPGAKLSDVKEVWSHPQGLMQCAGFFREHPEIRQYPSPNTAVAARMVSDGKDRSRAAIASALSAKLYGLEILKEGVNGQKDNTTRFIVAGREKIFRRGAKKVSIIFETPHEVGALHKILGHFLFNHINLLKLESRPIPEKSWEYRFFADIEGSLVHPAVISALESVRQQAGAMRVLGSY